MMIRMIITAVPNGGRRRRRRGKRQVKTVNNEYALVFTFRSLTTVQKHNAAIRQGLIKNVSAAELQGPKEHKSSDYKL